VRLALRRLGLAAAGLGVALAVLLARGVFALARLAGPDRTADFGGWLLRAVGPRLAPHRTALENLAAAFPEKTAQEREAIALAAWDNLGRTGGEYPHLAKLVDYRYGEDNADSRIEVVGVEHFAALRDDGRPGIVFTAHLANWELPAIVAERHGLKVTAVYRAPNDPVSRRLVEEIRRETMGRTEASRPGVAFVLRDTLDEGGHLGMLIDQHRSDGVTTPFFDRPAITNPVLAKLARRFECPVHGVRVVRLPGRRFRVELTPPLDLPRDARGRIDEVGAMRMMTAVVEGWVREHPGQWLWMHRRWRPPQAGRRGRRARESADA
jgi:KDO2-lipid IV(A) lauroyltransferase